MDCEKLIETVKQYHFIYDPEDKKYSDFDKKEAAWREIGRKLNQPGKVCKKTWNNLRDCFRRSLKKRKTSSRAAIKLIKWKYDDEMSFLTMFLREREPISSTKTFEKVKMDFPYQNNDEESNEEHGDIPPPPLPREEGIKKKRKEFPTASASLMEYILNNKQKNDANKPNELDLFFSSMASTVKRFSPYNRAIAKARVFSVISELELENLSTKNTTQKQEEKTATYPSL